MNTKDETVLACVAIVGVSILESVAMLTGNDGQFFALAIGSILTLAGVAGARVAIAKA